MAPSPIAALNYISVIGYSFGALLHTIGLLLLWKARRTDLDTTQRLILTNFSFTEWAINVNHVVSLVLDFYQYSPRPLSKLNVVLYHSFYFSVIFLTINRLMRFYLNIRYASFWTTTLTWLILAISWTTSAVSALLIHYFLKNSYLYVPLDGLFVVIALITYGYALRAAYNMYYVGRDDGIGSVDALQKHNQRLFKGFFMTSLIILTFFIFICVPDLILEYGRFFDPGLLTPHLIWACDFLYVVGYWCDALIYIFISPHIRNMLGEYCSGIKTLVKWR